MSGTASPKKKTPYQQRLDSTQETEQAKRSREYLARHKIMALFQSLATAIIHIRPPDVNEFIVSSLRKVSKGDSIEWNYFVKDRLAGKEDKGRGQDLVGFAMKSAIFVVGAPGLGTGRCLGQFAPLYGYTHLSAGDLLREAARPGAEKPSPHQAVLAKVLEEGNFVPSPVAVDVVAKGINAAGNPLVVVDGFPANSDDLALFAQHVADPDFVIFVECPEAVLAERSAVASVAMKKRIANYVTKTALAMAELAQNKRGRVVPWNADEDVIAQSLEAIFSERTLAIIKPDAVAAGSADAIVAVIVDSGFRILSHRQLVMDDAMARAFYAEHSAKGFFEDLVRFMTEGPVVALSLERPNAIQKWRDLMGPTSSEKARELAPKSLRALYGSNNTRNATHGSDSLASAAREIGFFFPADVPPKRGPGGTERTFAMIKPDATEAGNTDAILALIAAGGFEVVMRESKHLTREQAALFYREHQGKPFFNDLLGFMTSGPVLAMVLQKRDAIRDWRALLGPTNSGQARATAPQSIRAKFGIDGQKNAAHGSDSGPSAEREIAFFFGADAALPSLDLERSVAIILPHMIEEDAERVVDMVTALTDAGFTIVKREQQTLGAETAGQLLARFANTPEHDQMLDFFTFGPCEVLALEKVAAVDALRFLAGPHDSDVARETSPASLRAQFGIDVAQNSIYTSDSREGAAKDLALLFGSRLPPMKKKKAVEPVAATLAVRESQKVVIGKGGAAAMEAKAKEDKDKEKERERAEEKAKAEEKGKAKPADADTATATATATATVTAEAIDIDLKAPETARAADLIGGRFRAKKSDSTGVKPVEQQQPKKQGGDAAAAESAAAQAKPARPEPTEAEKAAAAKKIQALGRGRNARKEVAQNRGKLVAERDARRAEREKLASERREQAEAARQAAELDPEVAAQRIQAVARGRHARREVKRKREELRAAKAELDSALAEVNAAPAAAAAADDPTSSTTTAEEERAAIQLQRMQRGHAARRNFEKKKAELAAAQAALDQAEADKGTPQAELDAAAVKIQAAVKGREDRKRVKELRAQKEKERAARAGGGSQQQQQPDQDAAATKIASAARGRQARKRVAGIRAERGSSNNDSPRSEVSGDMGKPPSTSSADQDAAATKIASVARGRQARKRVAGIKAERLRAEEAEVVAELQAAKQGGGGGGGTQPQHSELEMNAAALRIQSVQRGRAARKAVAEKKAELSAAKAAVEEAEALAAQEYSGPEAERSAVMIQRLERGRAARKEFERKKAEMAELKAQHAREEAEHAEAVRAQAAHEVAGEGAGEAEKAAAAEAITRVAKGRLARKEVAKKRQEAQAAKEALKAAEAELQAHAAEEADNNNDNNDDLDEQTKAATAIQRVQRGKAARKRVEALRRDAEAKEREVSAAEAEAHQASADAAEAERELKEIQSAVKLQAAARGYAVRKEMKEKAK